MLKRNTQKINCSLLLSQHVRQGHCGRGSSTLLESLLDLGGNSEGFLDFQICPNLGLRWHMNSFVCDQKLIRIGSNLSASPLITPFELPPRSPGVAFDGLVNCHGHPLCIYSIFSIQLDFFPIFINVNLELFCKLMESLYVPCYGKRLSSLSLPMCCLLGELGCNSIDIFGWP